MATIILKWNPTKSKFRMKRFLSELGNNNFGEGNILYWFASRPNKIHRGDHLYFVKVGDYGEVGIVMAGKVFGETQEGLDEKGEKCYFFDYIPNFMMNPNAVPIITCDMLEKSIPEVDWRSEKSEIILDEKQVETLENMVNVFLVQHCEELCNAQMATNSDMYFIN